MLHIKFEIVESEIKLGSNGKTPDLGGINLELYKYGGKKVQGVKIRGYAIGIFKHHI